MLTLLEGGKWVKPVENGIKLNKNDQILKVVECKCQINKDV